jgi:hypothetical protein
MLNAEHQLDRNGHPIVASPSANWRDTNANGEIVVSLSGVYY